MSHYRDIYEKYLQSPEWAAKREQALERDARRCRACNSPEKLEVHHRTYARLTHEDLNDLTTLCESCHGHFHKKMRQDEMIARTYSAPRTEPQRTPLERERAHVQNLEDVLIGLILEDPSVLFHVNGILAEQNFAGRETRALYSLLLRGNGLLPLVSPELMPVVERCKQSIQQFHLSVDEKARVKIANQSATRLKRLQLLRGNNEIQQQVAIAQANGDTVEVRRLLQSYQDFCDQSLRISRATGLEGKHE